VPGKFFRNVGSGAQWHLGFWAKIVQFDRLLAQYVPSHRRKLIILMDSDVGFGGCSDDELLTRYHKMTRAGGAPVVVGGDPWQNPPTPGLQEAELRLRTRKEAMFRAFGLKSNAWAAFEKNRDPPNDDLLFVNSGFIMGPAEDVYKLILCMKQSGWDNWHAWFDDQRGLGLCMTRNPTLATIDYTGTLVATMFAMAPDLLEFSDLRVRNRLAGVTQCFVHTDCSKCGTAWPEWLRNVTRSLPRGGGVGRG